MLLSAYPQQVSRDLTDYPLRARKPRVPRNPVVPRDWAAEEGLPVNLVAKLAKAAGLRRVDGCIDEADLAAACGKVPRVPLIGAEAAKARLTVHTHADIMKVKERALAAPLVTAGQYSWYSEEAIEKARDRIELLLKAHRREERAESARVSKENRARMLARLAEERKAEKARAKVQAAKELIERKRSELAAQREARRKELELTLGDRVMRHQRARTVPEGTYTAQEAALMVGVTRSGLHQLMAKGVLAKRKTAGGAVFCTLEDIEKALARPALGRPRKAADARRSA